MSRLPRSLRGSGRLLRTRWAKVVLGLILIASAVAFDVSALSERLDPNGATAPTANAPDGGRQQRQGAAPTDSSPAQTTLPPEPPVGPYQPNTAGQIMVIAYHAFGSEEGRWTRTPAGFLADLQALYRKGYRPVNLIDMVTGKMDVPKGYSPVVITFDDGREGQFRYITGEDGQQRVDPTSAVGVMLAFNKDHPDWKLRATFFVSDVPFQKADWPEKVRFLVANGMEIGDHTLSHVSLAKATKEATIKEVGGEAKRMAGAIPGYNLSTLALPGGEAPAFPDVALEGVYDGFSYSMKATVLVGAGPAPSPLSKNFNPQRIPRIQAVDPSLDVQFALPYWMSYFDKHPELRYVSDGTGNMK